jgi:hypothetical protein
MSPFGARRWHRALILFTALFILSVITQFGIGWYQRSMAARNRLHQLAKEISNELQYSEKWNLTHFRQADFSAESYSVLYNNGLCIEIGGFVPPMVDQVKLDNLPVGLQTINIPETKETWRLYVGQVAGGTIVLGVSPPEDVTNIDQRLIQNAKRFGSSIETALQVNTGEIDRNLDYAVIDSDHNLRFDIGGIPLRYRNIKKYPINMETDIYSVDSNIYGVFSMPFPGGSANAVGTINTFDKLPSQPWFILRAWVVNCSSSAVLAFIGTGMRPSGWRKSVHC